MCDSSTDFLILSSVLIISCTDCIYYFSINVCYVVIIISFISFFYYQHLLCYYKHKFYQLFYLFVYQNYSKFEKFVLIHYPHIFY